jgi:hypothetical protein
MLLDTLRTATGAYLAGMGLIEGLPSDAYHSMPGVSKSGLDRLAVSPAHYVAYLNEPREETPALRFGRVFHSFILEPDTCRIAAWTGGNRSTRAGKAEWEEFQQANAGAEVVSADEFLVLHGMRDAVYAHPRAKQLLSIAGRAELSKWAYEPQSGELCRVRPDRLLDMGLALDLKSAKDASPRGFAKACAERRYHVQAAFYPDMLGLDDKAFLFVAVEKEPPYAVAVYELEPEAVEFGRYLYQRDLMRLAECKISKAWPAYSDEIKTLSLPAWATKGE